MKSVCERVEVVDGRGDGRRVGRVEDPQLEPAVAAAERLAGGPPGARLLPPMPPTTAVVNPASRIASPNASSAAICVAKWTGASSQPSRSAIVAWTAGSLDQRLVSRSNRPLRPALRVPAALHEPPRARAAGADRRRRMASVTSMPPGSGSDGSSAVSDRQDLVQSSPMARLAVKRAARNARAHSNASSGPITREPRVRTFMSSCSTPWWAEYVSWQTAARTPRILFAATDAPTPEPQMRMPALGRAVADGEARAAAAKSG